MYTSKGNKEKRSPEYAGDTYSINNLMMLQPDFATEQTLPQYHAQLLGVKLERSPKCHPEIAREGVEYGWGLSKMFYQRSLNVKKRNKDLFHKLVMDSVDNESVLNVLVMQRCSKKAQDYMVMYKAIESLNLDDTDGIKEGVIYNKHSILESSMKLYRKLQRTKKSHRSIHDNQLYDLREMEVECNRINPEHDSKEQLVRYVVSKMITLKKCEC